MTYRGRAYNPRAYIAPASGGGSASSGDIHYNNVKLLLHGDGTNNGTVFTDNSPSPKTPTANGNVKTVTAQSVFGGSSIYFDGTGDYLQYAHSRDWGIGLEDFCVEFRWRPDGAVDSTICVVCNDTQPAGSDYSFGIRHLGSTGSGKIQFFAYDGINLLWNIQSTTGWTTATWKAIRCIRTLNDVKILVDGVVEVTAASIYQAANLASTMKLNIGLQPPNLIQAKGWLDEFRFTKFTPRDTGNYTVDSLPFPDSL